MRQVFLFAAALLACGSASAGTLPFYDAFVKFCGEPAGDPAAMALAVAGAGGKFMGNSEMPAMPVTAAQYPLWTVAFEDKHFRVMFDIERHATNPAEPPLLFVSCEVVGENPDPASVDAIRKWIGVAPGKAIVPSLATFEFRYEGAKRIALTAADGPHIAAFRANGGTWDVTIDTHDSQPIASINVMRTSPAQ